MKTLLCAVLGSLFLSASSFAGAPAFNFQKATFSGFVEIGADSPGDSGGVKVTTTATGGYTIKGSVAKRTVSVKGTFENNGTVDKDIKIKVFFVTVATIHLNMQLQPDGETLTGSFSIDGGTPYEFNLYRAFYSKSVTTVHAGKFTALLASPGGDYPGGTGYATVNITPAGGVKVVGKLADGGTISTGGAVSVNGGNDQIPVFNILYNRRGALGGFVSFTSTDSGSGALIWVRIAPVQGQAPGKLVPDVYKDKTVTMKIQRYTAPAKNTVALPGLDMNGSVVLNLTGGNLNPFLTKTGTISTANKLTITSPNDEKVKATISKTSGIVSGSFKVILNGATKATTIPFKGVISQTTANAKIEGYFIGGDKSGVFKIEAD